MKKTFRYMAAAVAILAAFSCAKQEINAPEEGSTPPNTYEYVLNVTQEGDSKTTMDGNSILWSADDVIGVSCKYYYIDETTGATKSTYAKAGKSGGEQAISDAANYTPSTSATFTLNLTEGYIPLAAGYPYNAEMRCTSGGGDNNVRYDVNIPAVQTGVPGNIPAGSMAMVGKILDNECQMFNVGAVIKFKIKKENISQLKFEGNNGEIIAGRRLYYIDTGNFAYETGGSDVATSVTLVPSGTAFEPGDYYFVVSPNDLTEGFTMTLTTTDGQTSVRKTSTRFNIERNHKYTNFGSDDWAIDIATCAAGNLGSADGTTATLYAIVSGDDIAEGDTYGFEISSDGENWTKYDGTIGRRTSVPASYNTLNVLTASMTGLVPETTMYYRTYYTTGTGATTHGTTRSFKTYANAETSIMDLYNGWDSNYWPFPDLTVGEHINKGNSAAAVSKGTEFTMTTASGHEFTAKATGGVWLGNSNGCLTMKVSAGDYLKLPSVAGKKPISVTVVAGNTGGSAGVMGKPSIASIENESYTTVIGGGSWAPKPNYKYNSYTWEIVTDSEDNAIYFNAGDNCYISYIEVVYVNANTDTRPAEIEQNLVFSTRVGGSGGAAQWPFYQTFVNYKTQTNPTPVFYSASFPDLKYQFHITGLPTGDLPTDNSEKYKEDWWRQTAGAGLSWGSAVDDYMAILPVEDYKVTCIKIRNSNKTPTYSVTDANGTVLAGPYTANGKADEEIIFTISNTLPNTEYRLVVGGELNKNGVITPGAIREMWITYELVK